MSGIASNQFAEVYAMLGIDTGELGCIMLDTEPIVVNDVIPVSDLWFDENMQARGGDTTPTSELEPHVTVLYGLMRSGPELKLHVDELLKEWAIPKEITIDKVDFFYGNPDEPNIAIVAKVKVTPDLVEGHDRLRLLPHIATYPDYQPHLTLAYVKDSADYQTYVDLLNKKLSGLQVKTRAINYGH